jgi:adenine deaminase
VILNNLFHFVAKNCFCHDFRVIINRKICIHLRLNNEKKEKAGMNAKVQMKKVISVATGREPADLMIRNCRIVDVFDHELFEGDVLVCGSVIAGFGGENFPPALKVVDAKGAFLVPGLINGHVHIESSHCCPEEYARLVVPCGVTTVIADPHEICNVCGVDGLDYMLKSSENIPLDVFYMFPSCVPATGFEHAGATLLAEDVNSRINNPRVIGLGEMMNVPGVVFNDDQVLEKMISCLDAGKHIDGHSPGTTGAMLDAYCDSHVMSDHECDSVNEMHEKIRKGMYVMLREGSACRNLLTLLPGVTAKNLDRCLFCTDDRQPKSILEEGDIDNNVRMAINAGMDPLDAVKIATLNGALCHRLYDRGAIAPGYKADFLIVDDLKSFKPRMVFKDGVLVAENGKCLFPAFHAEPENVSGRMQVSPLDLDSFSLKLESDRVRAIDVIPGGVVTGEYITEVKRDDSGFWIHDPKQDLLEIAVIERHHMTGFMSRCLIHGYGMRHGAIGTTIAHDSHNLIVIGDNREDMLAVSEHLIHIGGGVAIVQDGKVLDSLPLPIAGLMTTTSGVEVDEVLTRMHEIALSRLGVNPGVDPFMTLSFMALPVIPKLKITDSGLFDYEQFKFVPQEV